MPAKIIKPLVDGVIAALHTHDGTALADVSDRLRAQLPGSDASDIAQLPGSDASDIAQLPGSDASDIAQRLVDDDAAVLGPRRLVWPRASGVQWNPADDLCVALELRVEPATRR